MPNRLAAETSPYLLQHAHNPVDWYPWGEEALARARAEDRPILLSIGYSACHWCHVMERESFEDPATARQMNDNFVAVKVDREERPDLDSIYMSAVQQMTGSGGWPMTVFLTPDLKPFFGGTYFPPEERYGMPSFRQVMDAVSEAWTSRRPALEATAAKLTDAIAAGIGAAREGGLERRALESAARELKGNHDPVHGGFGGAPKFPQAMALDFLLRSWRRDQDAECLEVVEQSLVKMAHGGIYDHLGGGFARYSTDEQWLAPHFEKMLYDQALLASVYLHAFQVTGKPGYRAACTRTIDYVLRDLTSSEGGFYSAEDADSEGVEGLFYTWTATEVREALGDDYELFALTYDVTDAGNWEGRTILRIVGDRNTVPDRLGLSVDEYQERLGRARDTLFQRRLSRVRPARDEKVITAWNGLMLAAVAEAAAVLDRADYLDAARRNANLMLTEVYRDGRLARSWRDGSARLNGYLEDYACLAQGLLQLYQADFDPRWYEAALELGEVLIDRFSDPEGGIFYSTSDDHESLLFRPRDFDDNAVPAGNSVAVEVLIQLSLLSGEVRYRDIAARVASSLAEAAAKHPLFFGRLLSAIDLHLGAPLEVAVVGDLESETAGMMLREARTPYIPNKVLAAGPAGTRVPPLLADRPGDPVAAYVCRDFTCAAPAHGAAELRAQLTHSPTSMASSEAGWQSV